MRDSSTLSINGIAILPQVIRVSIKLIPDEKSLTNMKKTSTESLKKYVIKWHEHAATMKPPMKESKIVEVFIQSKDEAYYQYLLPALGKPFIEVLKMGEMIEDGIETGRIMSFRTLKETTHIIQKGSRSVGGKKNEEDAYAIVVGQWARSSKPRSHYSQAQVQVHAQVPYNHSQNPLYSISPPLYPVYNAQPHVQPPSYPQLHTPLLRVIL
ncbi:hypothetical protein CQW23_25453 [Capsicum baccatum]|uniref:Uncharacterized protein n=1 Tax=Capsicum baccatum TaxID=33114 RepID=A0A2G2VL20_CAPBA|nr:hypothetical protein CQW23_25453 [Capsicum baccatum]